MAITVNGGNPSGRRRFHGSPALSEINVTPFVDVVLVLLIIFMLTAHVMEFGIEVDVPQVTTTRESPKELPVVSITKTGETYLNETPTNIHLLKSEIVKRFGPGVKGVYVR